MFRVLKATEIRCLEKMSLNCSDAHDTYRITKGFHLGSTCPSLLDLSQKWKAKGWNTQITISNHPQQQSVKSTCRSHSVQRPKHSALCQKSHVSIFMCESASLSTSTCLSTKWLIFRLFLFLATENYTQSGNNQIQTLNFKLTWGFRLQNKNLFAY